jgi:hypothetical protein
MVLCPKDIGGFLETKIAQDGLKSKGLGPLAVIFFRRVQVFQDALVCQNVLDLPGVGAQELARGGRWGKQQDFRPKRPCHQPGMTAATLETRHDQGAASLNKGGANAADGLFLDLAQTSGPSASNPAWIELTIPPCANPGLKIARTGYCSASRATSASTFLRTPPVTTRISSIPAVAKVTTTCPRTVVSPHGRINLGWPMRLDSPAASTMAEIAPVTIPDPVIARNLPVYPHRPTKLDQARGGM